MTTEAHRCPACGKAIDPLRAGEVAFLGGSFKYFCDKSCKAAFLSDAPALVEPTAEPPPVAVAAPVAVAPLVTAPVVAPPVESPEPAPVAPLPPPRTSYPSDPRDDAPISLPLRAWGEEDAPTSYAPSQRGGSLHSYEEASRSRATIGLTYAATVLGALAVVIGLLGERAQFVRFVLAILAAVCALGRGIAFAGDRAEARPIFTSIPLLVATGAAIAAHVMGHNNAELVSLVAIAAAASAIMDEVAARSYEAMGAERSKLTASTDALARIANSTVAGKRSPLEVRPGELVIVTAGETVPVDGTVASGHARVSPWPYAPIDAEKREGDGVIAGARVVDGELRITAGWTGADRAIPRAATVERVDRLAPLPRLARAIAERATVPLILLGAGAAFIGNASVFEALATGCAVAFAVSMRSLASAVAIPHAKGQLRALGHGVLYRDAGAFDVAGHVDMAVVCARGTVLVGAPEIVAIETFGGHGENDVLAMAAGVLGGSPHPLALAVTRDARAKNLRPLDVRNPSHVGAGAVALDAAGERLVAGRRAFLLAERISVASADARASELEAQGRSVLFVSRASKLVGILALQDGLRAGARSAVQRLLDASIEVVLLSGEARETCESIARSLDIDHVRPEVEAQDRGAEVRALAEAGHVVAVIGRPAADDTALNSADLSIALGGAGLVGEWGIALASDDVRDAAFAVTIPREARDRARIAVVVGLVPAACAILTIALGVVPHVVGAAAGLVGGVAALLYAKES